MSVKYLGGLHPQNNRRMWIRQIFGGSTLHPLKRIDGCMSVKYLGGIHPVKYLTVVCPSNIWGVYTPKIIDRCMSVKYLGGLQPQNN